MSYSPTNWVDGTTLVDASNLNKLEQAVSENSDSIDGRLTGVPVSDDIFAAAESFPVGLTVFWANASDVENLPSGGFSSSGAWRYGFGIANVRSKGAVITLLYASNQGNLAMTSLANGSWNSWVIV